MTLPCRWATRPLVACQAQCTSNWRTLTTTSSCMLGTISTPCSPFPSARNPLPAPAVPCHPAPASIVLSPRDSAVAGMSCAPAMCAAGSECSWAGHVRLHQAVASHWWRWPGDLTPPAPPATLLRRSRIKAFRHSSPSYFPFLPPSDLSPFPPASLSPSRPSMWLCPIAL